MDVILWSIAAGAFGWVFGYIVGRRVARGEPGAPARASAPAVLFGGDSEGPVMLATVVYECLTCGAKSLHNLVRGEPLPHGAGFRAAHRDCDRAPVGKGLRP
jgi:hypothetical protein